MVRYQTRSACGFTSNVWLKESTEDAFHARSMILTGTSYLTYKSRLPNVFAAKGERDSTIA